MIACARMQMADDGIPEDVRLFVAAEIHSVEQLEVLLGLHRRPSQWLTPETVAAELRTSASSVSALMSEMAKRGLLEAEDGRGYRYRPTRPETERMVQTLDRLYGERRVTIITLIFSKPMDAVRAFSDAFRLRKDGE